MELSFVFAALKRRWWVVLIFAEIGILPLLLGGAPVTTIYESEARMEILPPDGARLSAGQPDRYLLSQLEVMNSRAIAEEVALTLGDVNEAGAVRRSSTFQHLPETDIVAVRVRQDDPELAQQVAQTIAETYIEKLFVVDAAIRVPELARYDQELAALREDLAAVNELIREAYAPYLDLNDETPRQIPAPDVLVPNESSERAFLIAEIDRVEQLRSTLVNTPSSVNSSIVQDATLPSTQITESGGVFEIAFLVGMTLLGVAVALLWARFSPKVLDELHVAEIVGVPVVTKLAKTKALKREPLVAFNRLPQDLISNVDQIAVQAEALAQIDQPLTIAVVGAQRGAATTTTAVAIASRFAAAEYSVLLVDADRRNPWITEVFCTSEHGGITSLLGLDAKNVDRIFTRTSEPDIRVLGLGTSAASLRRETAPPLVAASREAANIVVFDGGPLLDAASTVELCNVVDAIVLAVPLSDTRTDDLAVVSRQLSHVRRRVLPVLTSTVRGTASREPVPAEFGADSVALGGGLVAVAREAVEVREAARAPGRRTKSSGDDKPDAPGSNGKPASASGGGAGRTPSKSGAKSTAGSQAAKSTNAPTKSADGKSDRPTTKRTRSNSPSRSGSNGPTRRTTAKTEVERLPADSTDREGS